MGCDIHSTVQTQNDNGTWITRKDIQFKSMWEQGAITSSPFNWRAYGIYGFLANVRNYSFVPPLSEPRGLPLEYSYGAYTVDDLYLGDHSYSWLLVSELLAFNYDTTFEDRRIMRDGNGAADAGSGNGTIVTFRNFLRENFFNDLTTLEIFNTPDKTRIVFGFDS